jgi:hypothetical protein
MFGAVWAQAELRKVLGATGARVTEVELAVGHAHEHLDPAGHLADPTQQEALRDSVLVLLGELENAALAALRRIASRPPPESTGTISASPDRTNSRAAAWS